MAGIKRTKEDAAFSKMIRERAGWCCQRCGKDYSDPSRRQYLDCAHGFTRRTRVTRFDPSNAIAACYGCHQFIDSHASEKENLFRMIHGNSEYDRVAALAHERRDRV